MPSLQAVVFDLDGTLIDTVPGITRALNTVLASTGQPALSQAEVTRMIGDGVEMLMRRALEARGMPADPDALPRHTARLSELMEEEPPAPENLFPGVLDVLRRLDDDGVVLGVCTNKPEVPARIALQACGLDGLIGAVVGGDTLDTRKPAADPLLATIATLGAAPGRSVMVGDNHNDVATARAAGVAVVAVTYGYAHGPAHELDADVLIDSFGDLPDALARIEARLPQ